MSPPPQPLPSSPYPGIAPFSYAARHVFFAREQEARKLIRLIVLYRGVLLYSDSGVGKSSLLNAGLIPRAIEEGMRPERIRVQPIDGQEIIVERLSENADGTRPFLPSLFDGGDESDRVVLSVERFRQMLQPADNIPTPLLIFDQFEEWVTLFEEAATDQTDTIQDRILHMLVGLINDHRLAVKVMLTLREDYLAKLVPLFERCPHLPDQYLRLTALTDDQLYHAIRGPFDAYPDAYPRALSIPLSHRIHNQFKARVAASELRLTEVQIVCQRLFETKSSEPKMTQFFEDIGGVQGILEHYLDEALAKLDQEQQKPAIALLSRMITSAGTRHVISQDELVRQGEFSQTLLTTTLHNLEQETKLVRRERRRDIDYYEIASEFLIERIRRESHEAEQRRLQAAEAKAEREQQRARAEAKNARRLRWLAAALSVLFVVALTVLGYAWQQKQLAEQAKRESFSRELAARSLNLLNIDPERSTLLALHAISEPHALGQSVPKEAINALHRAVNASRLEVSFPVEAEHLNRIIFTPDGKQFAAATPSNTVNVWDIRSGRVHQTFEGHTKPVMGLTFSSDGKVLATASRDGTARIWDTTSGQELHVMSQHGKTVYDVVFSPNGRQVASASADRTAKIWNAHSGQELFTLRGHKKKVYNVAFSPDGKRLATVSADKTAKIWDTSSGQAISTLSGHYNSIYDVAFSPDSKRLATVSSDKTLKLWDVSSAKLLWTFYGHTNLVGGVAFSPNGRYIATSSFDRTAKVWHVKSRQVFLTLAGHTHWVWGVAFSPDGTSLGTISRDHTVKIWDLTPGREVLTFAGHADPVRRAVFSPDGRQVATASFDHTARIWDVLTGQTVRTLVGHTDRVWGVTFSPDGNWLATASEDKTAKIWDLTTGQERLTLAGHTKQVYTVTFSPDGKQLATASKDRTAKIWSFDTGEVTHTLDGHRSSVFGAVFSPDGKRLVTASRDAKAIVWDTTTGKHLFSVTHPPSWINQVAFSPDGTQFATAGRESTAKIWNAVTGDPIMTLSGHAKGLLGLAFSPDSKQLATASLDRATKVWDLASGRDVLTLTGHANVVYSVAFSPDGTRLVTTSSDRTARVYTLDTEELLAIARMRVTRSLSDSECERELRMALCPSAATAVHWIMEGKRRARDGDPEGATRHFHRAKSLDASLKLNHLKTEAKKWLRQDAK